ncbi:MAG: Ribosomal protein [Candidatus Adlerbacteria bacterium]|nr:Ribosomal protein [Candidatus Adlerbacteria bacterium]
MTTKSQDEESFTQANDASTVYEVGYHVIPTVPEAEVATVVDAIRAVLTAQSAEIISEQVPVKTTLAYRIERAASGKVEKFTESYFGFIKFATAPEASVAIHKALSDKYEVLRFIIVHTTREDALAPRRTVFASDRLEGKTIEKPVAEVVEKVGEVSEAELDKSIDALVTE